MLYFPEAWVRQGWLRCRVRRWKTDLVFREFSHKTGIGFHRFSLKCMHDSIWSLWGPGTACSELEFIYGGRLVVKPYCSDQKRNMTRRTRSTTQSHLFRLSMNSSKPLAILGSYLTGRGRGSAQLGPEIVHRCIPSQSSSDHSDGTRAVY